MRIISIIEDLAIVKKILIHLDLWATKNHDHPSTSSADIKYACLQAPLSIANEENIRSTRKVKAQEVSYEELPQLSFDESLMIMSYQCRLKMSIRNGHLMRIDSAGF